MGATAKQLYHGRNASRAGWPAAGGPLFGGGYQSMFFAAERMVPAPFPGQNNPPQVVTFAPLGTNAWFCRAVKMPVGSLGGSWLQWCWDIPAYVDTTVAPYYQVSLATDVAGVAPNDNTQVHIHWTCQNDGTAFVGGGPGTVFDKVVGAAGFYLTPELQVPVTGPGAYTPGGLANMNLYRAGPWALGDSFPNALYILGCHIRFKVN